MTVNLPLLYFSAALVAAGFVLIQRSRFDLTLIFGGLWLFTASIGGFYSTHLAFLTALCAGAGIAKAWLLLHSNWIRCGKSWTDLWRKLRGLPPAICDRPLVEKLKQLDRLGWKVHRLPASSGGATWWAVLDHDGYAIGTAEQTEEAAVNDALQRLAHR